MWGAPSSPPVPYRFGRSQWWENFIDNIKHFNVEIIYRPGKHQLAANASSRIEGLPDDESGTPLLANTLVAVLVKDLKARTRWNISLTRSASGRRSCGGEGYSPNPPNSLAMLLPTDSA